MSRFKIYKLLTNILGLIFIVLFLFFFIGESIGKPFDYELLPFFIIMLTVFTGYFVSMVSTYVGGIIFVISSIMEILYFVIRYGTEDLDAALLIGLPYLILGAANIYFSKKLIG